MRILLDECVPRRFRLHLQGHEVLTVPEMGWASRRNGFLLESASGKFDVLITVDQRMNYQQNISRYAIAVVVLAARRNKIDFRIPLIPGLMKVLLTIKSGEVRRVGIEATDVPRG